MNNPMYEAQLNRHEEQIRDIDGRLHSYDLGLRWCEEQIKKIAGDDYSPVVVIDDDKETLERHNDNQRKEINQLLKANEELKREIQGLKTKLGVIFAEKEKVRGDYERLKQDNLGLMPFEEAYDKLKNNYNLLKEAYVKIDDRYNREKENFTDSIVKKDEKISNLERSVKTQIDIIDHLRSEIEKWKDACIGHQVDVNNFQGAYLEAKTENDRLTECLAKYAWRRVSTLELSPFEDNELYLFVVDGYPTPVKGKYHDESPGYITIIVDDGDGRGPQYKAFFFMDGCIRYWMPLPEMPDTAIK